MEKSGKWGIWGCSTKAKCLKHFKHMVPKGPILALFWPPFWAISGVQMGSILGRSRNGYLTVMEA